MGRLIEMQSGVIKIEATPTNTSTPTGMGIVRGIDYNRDPKKGQMNYKYKESPRGKAHIGPFGRPQPKTSKKWTLC